LEKRKSGEDRNEAQVEEYGTVADDVAVAWKKSRPSSDITDADMICKRCPGGVVICIA
jgi:hypothetical protein